MKGLVLLAFAAMASIGGCAVQSEKGVAGTASIPLSEFGSIRDWRAEGAVGLYIESDNRQWYHATFMSPCVDLPFAGHIGFRTTPPLPVYKFDSIEVDHQQCYFKSLDKMPGPPEDSPPKRPPA